MTVSTYPDIMFSNAGVFSNQSESFRQTVDKTFQLSWVCRVSLSPEWRTSTSILLDVYAL